MIKIYVLIDPKTKLIRYVGKTKNSLIKRLYEHCTVRNLKAKTHKNFWIKLLLKENLRPEIKLLEICNNLNWQEREIFWITEFNDLTNSTTGGEGAFGFKQKPETIKKAIETRRKNGSLKRSSDCIEKIRIAQTGKKHSKQQTEYVAGFLRKEIYQCDINTGNVINVWKGVRVCASTLNINHSGITRCLTGKQKTYHNFIWKYLSFV